MHPAYEVRKRIDGRIHYAVTATTSPRRAPLVPEGYDAVVREVTHGDETWYQHWVTPTADGVPHRWSPLAGLDLHFTVFQGVLSELSHAGDRVEWYKDHEPHAVEETYAAVLAEPETSPASFLDHFCRGQFLGNANHRTAILVLVALAAQTRGTDGGPDIQHDPVALRSFNACSKAVLEALAAPHAPRRALLERHLECCQRFVAATPWLQSMTRAMAFVERLSSVLAAEDSETSG